MVSKNRFSVTVWLLINVQEMRLLTMTMTKRMTIAVRMPWRLYVHRGDDAMEARSSLFLCSRAANFFSAVDETCLYRSTCTWSVSIARYDKGGVRNRNYFDVSLNAIE